MANLNFIKECSKIYRDDLVENILPFWLENSIDKECGGYATCVDREGASLDQVKSVWVQGRFAWVLSAVYNDIDKNSDYLEASKHGIDFIENHCFDDDGQMFFSVNRDGSPLRKRRYVFSETFAAIAMAEYSIASGDKSYADKALALFKELIERATTPGALEPKIIPGARPSKGHSFCMILLNTAYIIREAIEDPYLTEVIDNSLWDLENHFMHEEFEALLENVTPEGKFIDDCDGRTINPGHAIETAWFVLEEAKYRGDDQKLIDLGLKILDWSWKWGWDTKDGGITYFRDCKNRPSQEYWQDMKFWWPQNEAVIATLYAYLMSGDDKYLEWHKMIHEYAYRVFPDAEHGEWYGYLHKDGTVAQPAKGNLYKGPFHVPRMMLKGHNLCEEIIAKFNK